MATALARLSFVIGLAAVGGCGPSQRAEPPESEARATAATPSAPASARESAPRPGSSSCIRGGSTREEVRALMGEPDSVSFGAWIYGRSEISFGYGVVVDFSNDGGNLILC
ncbi:MAG: hypothetical protein OEM67_12440 [Thermoleophilia bacterium]|nr:hypothetical protein [Thermoleophilia bacterium]